MTDYKCVVPKKEGTDNAEGEKLMTDIQRGLKNKHLGKHEIQDLMDEVERLYLRLHQIKRKAGFFDKRGNIFEEKKSQGLGTLH